MTKDSNGKTYHSGTDLGEMFAQVTLQTPSGDKNLTLVTNSCEDETVKFEKYCVKSECFIVNGNIETSSVYVGTRGQMDNMVVFDLYLNEGFCGEHLDVSFVSGQENCTLPRIHFNYSG